LSNRSGSPFSRHPLPLSLALMLLAGILPATRAEGTAQTHIRERQSLFESAIATKFEPPDPEPPSDREGSGSRTSCPPVDKPLTALIPSQVNYTLSGHPTFWFYVPYAADSPRDVEFVLLDEDETEVYKIVVPIAQTPGIVSFRLPDSIEPLTIGQEYVFQFSYRCNPRIRAEDDYVGGIVQRVTADATLTSQLEAATTPMQRVELYAQSGLWYETLAILAELYRNNPGNDAIATEWQELLRSIGLEHLAHEPIVDCCTN
jgi:hypothetical protein